MDEPVIQRYISDENNFKAICIDFEFLVKKIKKFGFEYSLEIRQDYFNLYYQGNSIGKIVYQSSKNLYKISINEKFVSKMVNGRFKGKAKNDYVSYDVPSMKLPAFFSDSNLKSLSQSVKDVNFQEETSFEQMLMTDNIKREDFVIIDRQVVDHTSNKKMDLLTVKRIDIDNFQFCVIEVKLGNNPELSEDVAEQLYGYVQRIKDHFDDYKKSYEKNFEQKRALGLIEAPLKIVIVPPVIGLVVVGGYSGLARESIKALKAQHEDIKVLHLRNEIDFTRIE